MVADLVQSGLASWWAPVLAFAAGVVSFASPCVFPLVPGYLAFVSGSRAEEERRPVLPIVLFLLGFAVVFTALGAFTRVFQPVFRSELGLRISGIVILLFGVVMILYGLRLGWPGLYAERRPLLARVKPGPKGAFPLGMAFATGWTPCIGPVLAGILALASAQGGSLWGAFLMFTYSMGLGLPFLLIGLGVHRLVKVLAVVKRNYHWLAGASGVVMAAIGVLLITGLWTELLAPVFRLVRTFEPPI